ncbi:MAG: DUF3526 domain-containing protein [Chitinophagaceae bacterium]
MVGAVMLKEWKEFVRTGRLVLAAIFFLALLAVSIYTSWQYSDAIQTQYTDAGKQHRANWENQAEKNPHAAAHFGTYVFKPKSALSLIDPGVDKFTGVAFYLEPHKQGTAQYSAVQDETSTIWFGELTPAFVLLYLIPLLIILLGFNAFTKEREYGTAKLMMIQGAGKLSILAGKSLMLLFVAFVIMVPVLFSGLIISAGSNQFSAFSMSNLLVLLVMYLLYYIVIINVCLFVSSVVQRSGLSFLVLLCFWMVSTFIVPKVAANIAEQQNPSALLSDLDAMVEKRRSAGIDGHNAANEQAKKLEAEVLKMYGVDSVSQLPVNIAGIRLQRGEAFTARIYDSVFGLLKTTLDDQSLTFSRSAVFSPFSSARFLSMAFCGSDYEYHWHFANAAEKYRLYFVQYLNEDIVNHSKTGEDYTVGRDLYSSIKPFSYQPQSLGETVNQQRWNILALCIWLLVSSLLVMVAVQKLKI